jgi:hypothetical protein
MYLSLALSLSLSLSIYIYIYISSVFRQCKLFFSTEVTGESCVMKLTKEGSITETFGLHNVYRHASNLDDLWIQELYTDLPGSLWYICSKGAFCI